jgi:hypothetical protein
MIQTGMIDLIPLWLWSDKDLGGLEYSQQKIGMLMLISALSTAVVQ